MFTDLPEESEGKSVEPTRLQDTRVEGHLYQKNCDGTAQRSAKGPQASELCPGEGTVESEESRLALDDCMPGAGVGCLV